MSKQLKWEVSEFEPNDSHRIGGIKVDHIAWLRRDDGRFISMNIGSVGIDEKEARDIVQKMAEALSQTPAALWREEGKPDPHDTRYDCERHETLGGRYTDDQIANAVFLQPNIQTTTNAKDRIRWLSRRLTKCEEALKPFAEYADTRFPADAAVTKGSPMAKRQLSMGDCHRAYNVLNGLE